MPHTPAAAALTDLTAQVQRLSGLLLLAADRLSAPEGQTASRWQVMSSVDAAPQSVAAIARTLGLTRQSVQRTADLLVAEGLARYETNPEHRRAKLLRLTPEGQRILTSLEETQVRWANRVAHRLSEGDLKQAAWILAAVERALPTA